MAENVTDTVLAQKAVEPFRGEVSFRFYGFKTIVKSLVYIFV